MTMLVDSLSKIEANKWTAFPGGASANVATACCKLGTKAAYIGCLGQDEDGGQLEALLKETGVDTSLIQRDESMPTRRVMVTQASCAKVFKTASLETFRRLLDFRGAGHKPLLSAPPTPKMSLPFPVIAPHVL
ncbi:unnamed protein product [Cylindrotheca closterium]|uniref:Carbohydrate kinase PfkB domain-containing protein n=1 Tax=Cylindrotheca closterium TaxID=2856 RepID=A0AAD2PUE5_9STRA|nr:unnamed protein product [Cylindrotheca closterium]CAJ1948919.1 unnamed protein product [Cylindrotheca closterium]